MKKLDLDNLIESVSKGDISGTKDLVMRAVDSGFSPLEVIEEGLAKGVRRMGDLFGRGEVFLPELIRSVDAMKAGMEVLMPKLIESEEKVRVLGRVVIGTVEGDIHDIGKNIVASLLTADGFEVMDLGADVPVEKFVEKVREEKPDIVGLSALLTTTMPKQKEVIEALKRANLRAHVKVIIGGAPVSDMWAREIEADGYADNAIEAVKLVRALMGISVEE